MVRSVDGCLILCAVLAAHATGFGQTVESGDATLNISSAGAAFSYGPEKIIVSEEFYLSDRGWKRISRDVQYEIARTGAVITKRTKKNPLFDAQFTYTLHQDGVKIDTAIEILPNSGANSVVWDIYLAKPTFAMANVQRKGQPPGVLDPKSWKTIAVDKLAVATATGHWQFALAADSAAPWKLRSECNTAWRPAEQQTFDFLHAVYNVPARGMKQRVSFEARMIPNRGYLPAVERRYAEKGLCYWKALADRYRGKPSAEADRTNAPASQGEGRPPMAEQAVSQVKTLARKVCEASADLDQSRIVAGTETVIPEPKSCKRAAGGFHVPRVLNVACSPDHEAAIEVLSNDLTRHGVRLRRVESADASLVMGMPSSDATVADACQALGVAVGPKDPAASGYKLVVTPEKILLAANDAAGVLYGAQTLRQLVRSGTEGAEIAAVSITDWPDMKFRGFYVENALGRADREELQRLIRDAYSYFKANVLIVELRWPHVRWRSHPEVAGRDARPVEELAALAAYARRYHLQFIPVVYTYGKTDDLFASHPEIAEDLAWRQKKQMHGAYCPNRPQTYALIFDIMQEIIDATKCRAMHIGHDEIEGMAICPACSKIPPSDLFAADVNKIADWLAERKVLTMLWGDMLLEEKHWAARGVRGAANSGNPHYGGHLVHPALEKIRKHVIIGDWHYTPDPTHPTMKHFAANGFRVVGCTWYNKDNNYYMTQEMKAVGPRGLGVLVTDWGFMSTRSPGATSILGAAYAWNTAMPEPKRLTWSPDAVLAASILNRNKPSRIRDATLTPIDLERVGNRALSGDKTAWFGMGTWHDLAYLPRGDLRLFGVDYRVGKTCLIVGAGNQDAAIPSNSPAVPVRGKAKSLVFLHALSVSNPGVAPRTFGHYRVTYASGQKEDVAISSRNATHWLSETPRNNGWGSWTYSYLWDATLAWEGCTKAGEAVNLQAYEWVNPRPNDRIATVELIAQPGSPGLRIALVALTAVR